MFLWNIQRNVYSLAQNLVEFNSTLKFHFKDDDAGLKVTNLLLQLRIYASGNYHS